MRCESIIDCKPTSTDIKSAINTAFSPEFRESILEVVNPYGAGGAPERIVEILDRVNLDDLVQKSFYDLEVQ